MPHIQVHAIRDVFNAEQKREVIEKLTDAMVSVEGENLRGVTWVSFHEVESGDWGIGGQCLTTADVKALQKG
ncbi:MAG TPA: tautomerase family protein [Woeseiaceae bacterium]|nr:tautomerase family protein [Woeseiaceae bacterium]